MLPTFSPDCRLAGLATLLFVALVGCGPSGPLMYPVSGTVTFDGEPLPDGYISFVPENPSLAPQAGPISAGRFDFRARPGLNKVQIQAAKFIGPEIKVMGLRPKEMYIPKEYNRETTLSAEVTAEGKNQYTFELKSEE